MKQNVETPSSFHLDLKNTYLKSERSMSDVKWDIRVQETLVKNQIFFTSTIIWVNSTTGSSR